MEIPSTVRDPKILAQRRGELVDVATRLFLEKGYPKTSIRDIARACPFNLAALYMYVSSKEDILFLVAQQLVTEIVDAIQPASLTNHDPAEALVFAFQTYCSVVERLPRHIRLLYRELDLLPPQARGMVFKSVASLIGIFEDLLTRAMKAKRIRKVDAKLVGLDMMVLAHMWALHGRQLRDHLDMGEFMRGQRDLMFYGLIIGTDAEVKAVLARGAKLGTVPRAGATG